MMWGCLGGLLQSSDRSAVGICLVIYASDVPEQGETP